MKKIVLLMYLFLISILSLLSCASGETNVSEVNLVPSDTLYLDIDDKTFYETSCEYQFEENGKEYLMFMNNQKGDYYTLIWDLQAKQVISRIPHYEDGPNSVIRPFGIGRLSSTRYIIPSDSPYIFLVNEKGEVLDKWQLFDMEHFFESYCTTNISNSYNLPFLVRDSIWYFSQSRVGKPKKKEDWVKTSIFAKLNLKTGELSKTKVCYPDLYKEDEDLNRQLYRASFSYDTDGENIACAFLQNDSVYVTKDFEHVKAIAAKSRYLEHLEPEPYSVQPGLADKVRNLENMAKYWSLIYDKYRKVWYRFAFLQNEMPKEQDPFEYTIPQLKFSIMILDKDFNVIGETAMPANTYAYRMWFVGKKGLYLSMNNVKNPIFSEDQLIFQCLELK